MSHKKITNILHLSDLHFKTTRTYDQEVVLNALLDDITKQAELVGKPDLIIFSGDLVHSADDDRVYEKLYDTLIDPLLRRTNCDHSRLFLSPGNHDIQRSFLEGNKLEQETVEIEAQSRETLNEFYLSGKASEFARKKSQTFYDFADFFEPEGSIYKDSIMSVNDLPETGISIVTLNTAWLGWAGLEKRSDLQNLSVPEAAISMALKKVPQGRYLIFNLHHPVEWQAEFASRDFRDLVPQKANLLLYGHVHDPRPIVVGGDAENVVHNQSGALYTSRKDRYLGYSMIRVFPEGKHTELTWRSYFDKRRAFDVANNVNDSLGVIYSSASARKFFGNILDQKRSLEINRWVSEVVRPFLKEEFDDGILDKPTPDLFVTPPLSKIDTTKSDEDETPSEMAEVSCSLNSILDGNDNHIFEAYPEHGKTALLHKICAEISISADEKQTSKHIVPVLLNFSNFVPGTKRVKKAIRDKLPGMPDGCDLELLLSEGCLTVCVDDVELSDAKRIRELREFIARNKENRIILSTTSIRQHDSIQPNISLGVHFERVRLHQFRRSDLRKLMRKFDDTNGSEEEMLERVIAELRAMNVPATPLNSSLLMDILSRDSSFSPLNRPTLIERFIETLLQKRSLGEVERKKFDFRNQVHYLGHVAESMCKNNCYVLKYDELFELTCAYLKNLGLNFGAREIINNTVSSKVFLEKPLDGTVAFRFRAFLEFFVATKLREDVRFKEWVLDEDRYLSFLNEVEYYAGLERNDVSLLQAVSKRHLDHYFLLFGDDFDKVLEGDQFSSLPTSLESSKRFAEELSEQMQEAPLSEKERDEVLDAELPRDAEGRQEVFRPLADTPQDKYILSLFMYTNLVKNTELIEDTEKRYHLSWVLKSWSSSIVVSFLAIPSLVKNRRMTLNGLNYTVSYPRDFTDEYVARRIALGLPKEISRMVHWLIGTEKLEQQLTVQTSQELGEPNVTAFLRSSLYIDLKLNGWWKEPGRFISKTQGDSYFQEVMLSKAADVYRLGAFSKSAGKELEDEIANTHARLYAPSKSDIQSIRNRKKKNMERAKNLSQMKAKLSS